LAVPIVPVPIVPVPIVSLVIVPIPIALILVVSVIVLVVVIRAVELARSHRWRAPTGVHAGTALGQRDHGSIVPRGRRTGRGAGRGHRQDERHGNGEELRGHGACLLGQDEDALAVPRRTGAST